MNDGEFVEKLDKLNRLKNEGIIDENEYEKQVNKLKKQYSKENSNYYSTRNSKTNTTAQNNAIASLLLLIILLIGGIWFFSSDVFKDLTTTGKEFINNFENYTTSASSYDYSTTGTSTYSNNITASSDNSNTQTQTQIENKKTYNINVRKAQKNNWGDELCTLTVMNYQTEAYNSEVGKVEAGQEWVIVNMKFENMSDSTIVIDKNDFKIVDGAGRYGYRPYYKHLDTELNTTEIRAGQSATFSVRFVYYKDYEMFLRFYHPSIVTEVYTDIKLR